MLGNTKDWTPTPLPTTVCLARGGVRVSPTGNTNVVNQAASLSCNPAAITGLGMQLPDSGKAGACASLYPQSQTSAGKRKLVPSSCHHILVPDNTRGRPVTLWRCNIKAPQPKCQTPFWKVWSQALPSPRSLSQMQRGHQGTCPPATDPEAVSFPNKCFSYRLNVWLLLGPCSRCSHLPKVPL